MQTEATMYNNDLNKEIIDIEAKGGDIEISTANQERLNVILTHLLRQYEKVVKTNLNVEELLDVTKAISDLQKSFFSKSANIEINAISDKSFEFFKNFNNKLKDEI